MTTIKIAILILIFLIFGSISNSVTLADIVPKSIDNYRQGANSEQ